jgi:hypothetical protein
MSDAADEIFKSFQVWLAACAPRADDEQRWLLECAWFAGVSSAMSCRSSLSAIAVVRHMDRRRARRQASPL